MENSEVQPVAKHSIFGILSLVLVILFILMVIAIIIWTYADDTPVEAGSLLSKIIPVAGFCILSLLPISQILAMVSFFQPNTKKIFAIVSLVLNAIACIPVLLIFAFFALLFLAEAGY